MFEFVAGRSDSDPLAESWLDYASDEEIERRLAAHDAACADVWEEHESATLSGPTALAYVATLEPETLSAQERIDSLAVCARVQSWVAAVEQRLLASIDVAANLSDERFVQGQRLTPHDLEDDWAREEVGAVLHLHPITAQMRLGIARDLVGSFPSTLAALSEGRISYLQAAAVVEIAGLHPRQPIADLLPAYEAALFPDVETMTVGETRRHAARILASLDPVDADERHKQRHAGRSVRASALPDGMGEVIATVGADGMLTTTTALNAMLDAARAAQPDDGRSADQMRADLFVELFSAVLTGGELPPVLFPQRDEDAPDDAEHGHPDDVPSRQTSGPGRRSDANARRRARNRWRRRTQLTVTCSRETATGEGNEPGHLDGYGPVPAALIRRLFGPAADDGSGIDLRAGIVDPDTGELSGLGRTVPVAAETLRVANGLTEVMSAAFGTVVPAELLDEGFERYRPSAFLDGYVRYRDRMCTFPGCSRRASFCDVDHIIAWPSGPTSAENLHCLCRRHHRLKTIGLWQVHRHADGRLTWTAPTGHTYDVRPPPRT